MGWTIIHFRKKVYQDFESICSWTILSFSYFKTIFVLSNPLLPYSRLFPLSGMVLHHKEFCRFPVSTHFPYSKETGETTKSLEKVIISKNLVFSCFWSLISSRPRKRLLFKNKSHMMGLFSTVPGCTWLCPIVPGCTLAYHDLPFQRMSHSATDWPEFFSGLNAQKL